ncbi:N-6 DNA methylase, partial [Archaeoglobus sp.]
MTKLTLNWNGISKLEDWMRKYYFVIVDEFGDKSFTAEDFENALKKRGLEIENVNKVISALKKVGLLKAKEDPKDARRKIYQLVFETYEERKPTRDDLIRLLKNCADLIRTAVDYKVLLLFLFYKVVSDKWNKIVEKYLREGFLEEQAYFMANTEYITLYDEQEGRLYTWHEVVKSRETISEMANAIIKISRMNERLQDLQKLVERLGLLGFITEENMHILEGLIEQFNRYDFSEVDYDAIGDAYQWILSYFAPQKAKEGETYTPREVIRLIVELLFADTVEIDRINGVLDPACGSGAMLIEAYNYAKEKTGKADFKLIGQERNEIMGVIAKMNLILHGITTDWEIYIGDSLRNPQFEKVDYVLANPPWNQDGYDEKVLGESQIKRYYPFGFPPKTTADWAWIQLMLYFANKKVGIVLDQGALFRGGKERNIRKKVVETDLVEAVILLPEKLFYNTGAPGVVIVFNREKDESRRGKILFINASNEYEQHPEVRRLNRLKNIDKIVEVYREFKDVE